MESQVSPKTALMQEDLVNVQNKNKLSIILV